jgi:stage V sporulation protein B
LYGAACAGVLFLSAGDLCNSLYQNADAGIYLRWFAPLAILLYCDAVTDAMIKGLGQQKASVRYNIFTNAMDVAFLYILLPKYGISGYFISFLVTHVINFGLSIRRLLKITGEKISLHIPILTLAAAAAAVWASGFVVHPFFRAAAYIILLICSLFLLQILTKEDIIWIKGLIRKK